MKRTVACAALLALSWAGASWVALAGAGEKGDPDKHFVKMAASAGQAEVKLGELAQERGKSLAVREFGKKIVLDHVKANNELILLCRRKGLEVPKEMVEKHRAAVEKLSKLKGAEFDAAYGRQMVEDHMEAIKLFEGEANHGKDAALKAFAAKALPALREHLKMARQLPGASASGG
jgi:putative membrane protein